MNSDRLGSQDLKAEVEKRSNMTETTIKELEVL
jgi:hypothetical protein